MRLLFKIDEDTKQPCELAPANGWLSIHQYDHTSSYGTDWSTGCVVFGVQPDSHTSRFSTHIKPTTYYFPFLMHSLPTHLHTTKNVQQDLRRTQNRNAWARGVLLQMPGLAKRPKLNPTIASQPLIPTTPQGSSSSSHKNRWHSLQQKHAKQPRTTRTPHQLQQYVRKLQQRSSSVGTNSQPNHKLASIQYEDNTFAAVLNSTPYVTQEQQQNKPTTIRASRSD
jgi:hypothetical protein